jgi:hypothetical protein
MSAGSHTERRPAELVPAAALVVAIVLTILPHAAGSDILSAEPARAVTRLHAEVAP